jgi:murein L,D-transpeptidase YafK
MRAGRVVVVGMMVGAALSVAMGCAAKRKAAPRILADEDRLDWARNEPTFVVVRKSCRTLDVYRYGERIRSYPAVFGQGGTHGRKLYEGDMRTPTGLYAIIGDRFHERWEHFFLLDYPNAAATTPRSAVPSASMALTSRGTTARASTGRGAASRSTTTTSASSRRWSTSERRC